MFKNIDISEINKTIVIQSVWVFFFGLIGAGSLALKLSGWNNDLLFIDNTTLFFGSLLFGGFLMLLFLGLCLVTEYFLIRQTTNYFGIVKILLIETTFLIGLNGLVYPLWSIETKLYCAIIICIAQLIRYLFLKWNNRMFNSANNHK